jgi:hypothetical protein
MSVLRDVKVERLLTIIELLLLISIRNVANIYLAYKFNRQ